MKEAEKYVGSKYVDQVIDPLYVVEKAMHHFFMLAESRKEIGGKLEEVNQLYERAAHLAALAAPYRHGRLSAIKLIGDPNAVSTFKPNATAEELRVELARRVAAMRDAGLIDLEALPPPERKVAN
jgi:hypothetical protein